VEGHYDEQSDIAVRASSPASMGTEKNDPFRVKLAHDPADDLPDLFAFARSRVEHGNPSASSQPYERAPS
jgi:hypothetical protein